MDDQEPNSEVQSGHIEDNIRTFSIYVRNIARTLEVQPRKKLKLSKDETEKAVEDIVNDDDTDQVEVDKYEAERRKPKRKSPCNKCSNCKTPDCQQCIYCRDKIKFGGPGIKKKPCKVKPKCIMLISTSDNPDYPPNDNSNNNAIWTACFQPILRRCRWYKSRDSVKTLRCVCFTTSRLQ